MRAVLKSIAFHQNAAFLRRFGRFQFWDNTSHGKLLFLDRLSRASGSPVVFLPAMPGSIFSPTNPLPSLIFVLLSNHRKMFLIVFYVFLVSSFVIHTPQKTNIEPENDPFEKENHLPNLQFWGVPCSSSRLYTQKKANRLTPLPIRFPVPTSYLNI